MTQLGLEGMPQPLFACTPSRLSGWTHCPRRYRRSYLDRPRPAAGPVFAHHTVGAVVHLALARWWALPRPRRTAAAARALLDAAWPAGGSPDGFRDAAQAQRWRERTGDQVQAYAAALDPDDEPVGVERTVGFRTDVLAVSGRVDRLDARAEGLVVVDYKTGRRPPGPDDVRGSLALALYAVAAARTLHRRVAAVELHHLPTGGVQRWEHDPDELEGHLRRAEATGGQAQRATVQLAAGGDPDALFPARPGPQCGWCDLLRSCPQGRAVATARQGWEGLDGEAAAPS